MNEPTSDQSAIAVEANQHFCTILEASEILKEEEGLLKTFRFMKDELDKAKNNFVHAESEEAKKHAISEHGQAEKDLEEFKKSNIPRGMNIGRLISDIKKHRDIISGTTKELQECLVTNSGFIVLDNEAQKESLTRMFDGIEVRAIYRET